MTIAKQKKFISTQTSANKVTLKHIADDTGLSISTVSRVLRGEGRLNGQHEQLIIESAQRLGYPLQKQQTPFELRRELFIAIVTHVQEGEFYASFFNGFHRASKESNVHFTLFSVEDITVSIEDFLFSLQKNFDAAVIFLPLLTSEDYKHIVNRLNSSFPILSTASILNPVLDTITFDAYGGGHIVAEHFHQKGYSEVGIIHGPKEKLECRFRSNGFSDFVSLNSEMEIVWEYNGDYSVESGRKAFHSYLNSTKKPRAIFCDNDSMLFGFIELARANGIRIPLDLALAGYDNLPMCQSYSPQITSVKTDFIHLGTAVMRLLLNRIENPIPHQGFLNLIPVTLMSRESS